MGPPPVDPSEPRFLALDIRTTADPDCPGIMGDFDDGDVDLDDYLVFTQCAAGPDQTPAPPAPAQECLDVFDFDADNDVDLLDAGEFFMAFTGS